RRSRSRRVRTTLKQFLAGLGLASATTLAAQSPPDPKTIVEALAPTFALRPNLTTTPRPTATPVPPQIVGPDGRSVDAIVTALYQSVSCGREVEPNWERMSALFLPGAKIVPPRAKGDAAISVLDGKAFQERVRKLLESWKQRGESTALYENEVARQEQCFGKVCQIFSTFQTRHAPRAPQP